MRDNPYLDPESKYRRNGYELCIQVICSHDESDNEHAPDWRNEYSLMTYGYEEVVEIMQAIDAVLKRRKTTEPSSTP